MGEFEGKCLSCFQSLCLTEQRVSWGLFSACNSKEAFHSVMDPDSLNTQESEGRYAEFCIVICGEKGKLRANAEGDNLARFSLGSFSCRLVPGWTSAPQTSSDSGVCCRDGKEKSGRGLFLSWLWQKSEQTYLEEKNLVTPDSSVAVLRIGRDRHKDNGGE